MVGRGDGLTSIRIYLSNDLKINAHEKNDFNDSAIGGTLIAFLRTETTATTATTETTATTATTETTTTTATVTSDALSEEQAKALAELAEKEHGVFGEFERARASISCWGIFVSGCFFAIYRLSLYSVVKVQYRCAA